MCIRDSSPTYNYGLLTIPVAVREREICKDLVKRMCRDAACPGVSIHSEQPVHSVTDEPLHHGVPERLGCVARRQIAEAALARLAPPAGFALFIVGSDGAQQ